MTSFASSRVYVSRAIGFQQGFLATQTRLFSGVSCEAADRIRCVLSEYQKVK